MDIGEVRSRSQRQRHLLLFEPDERGPSDDLRLQFEAASRLDPDERNALKSLIEGLLLKHEAKRWSHSAASATAVSLRAR